MPASCPCCDYRSRSRLLVPIYRLVTEGAIEGWYCFYFCTLDKLYLQSSHDFRQRFIRKGKEIPNRTTISLSPANSAEYLLENRIAELLGEKDPLEEKTQ